MWISTFAVFASAVIQGAAAQNATRATTTFLNSVKYMFDTDGNQIDAYAAKIQRTYSLAVNSPLEANGLQNLVNYLALKPELRLTTKQMEFIISMESLTELEWAE